MSYTTFRTRLSGGLSVRCEKCLYGQNIDVHHIFPRMLGGTDEAENLTWLCFDCHIKEWHTLVETGNTYEEVHELFNFWISLPPYGYWTRRAVEGVPLELIPRMWARVKTVFLKDWAREDANAVVVVGYLNAMGVHVL